MCFNEAQGLFLLNKGKIFGICTFVKNENYTKRGKIFLPW